MTRRFVTLFLFCLAVPTLAQKRVVMVSVDGLRPDFYLDPSAHGAELPNFREMMREGVYAEGVEGVFPTVTYPSHTSLVTGVRPARHGILNNYVLDETGRFRDWYWYARDIRVPALWDVAEGVTAAVDWPVSVGADIDFNFPEFWVPGSDAGWRAMRADVVTPALLEALEAELGRLPEKTPGGAALDGLVFDAGELLLERFRPQLLLLHVVNTDSAQHTHGREHPAVTAAFELVDARLGRFRMKLAALGMDDETLLVVTGDHGFIPTHTAIHMNAVLRDAGLLDVSPGGTVASYRVLAWPAGASCAIVLADADDEASRKSVEALVDELLRGPLGGAMTKVSREELDELGAMPGALFMLEAKEGYLFGTGLEGDVLAPSPSLGYHGNLPSRTRIRTGFLMVGPGVRAGVRVPQMRLIDVAPTIAHWAGWTLPGTDGLALAGLFEKSKEE